MSFSYIPSLDQLIDGQAGIATKKLAIFTGADGADILRAGKNAGACVSLGSVGVMPRITVNAGTGLDFYEANTQIAQLTASNLGGLGGITPKNPITSDIGGDSVSWKNIFASGYLRMSDPSGLTNIQRAIFNSRFDENLYDDMTDRDIWAAPAAPFFRSKNLIFYCMGIDPINAYSEYVIESDLWASGNIYVSSMKIFCIDSRTYLSQIFRLKFSGAISAWSLGIYDVVGAGKYALIQKGTNPTTIRFVTNDAIGTTTTDNLACDVTAYHVYEIRAKAGSVKLYLDGTLIATHTTNFTVVPLYYSFFDCYDDTVNSAKMWLDYIHIFQGVAF